MEKRRRTVAIVEHDPDDRLLLKEAFEECHPDLRVDFFDNGRDLLDCILRSGVNTQPTGLPNLILMTLDLPGRRAFDIIAEIKATPELKRIPCIVLIGTAIEKDLRRCYDLGANTVVTKPGDYKDLVKLIKSICEFWFTIAST